MRAVYTRAVFSSGRTDLTTFSGVIPILATPFLPDDEALDLQSWERLIEFMIGLGVDGLTILGVLGESNRLTDQERQTLIRTAVAQVRQRVPVIVGASHSGTRAAGELARMAEDLGADAVMIGPGKEPVPSDDRIVETYQCIYLDRVNISCAALQMTGDLKFSNTVFGFGAGIFFIGYFLLQIPGTMLVELWSARKFIGATLIIGNLGGFVGPYIIGFLSDKTGTCAAGLSYLVASGVLGGLLLLSLSPDCTRSSIESRL